MNDNIKNRSTNPGVGKNASSKSGAGNSAGSKPSLGKAQGTKQIKKATARSAAVDSLLRCERDGRWSNLEIDSVIKKTGLDGAERSLYTTLVYGVIECRITLDYIIAELSTKPISTLDAEVLTILRLGLYQLLKLDRIPESAAVNESVALTKVRYKSAASFVNALLREFLRKYGRHSLPLPDKSDREEYLSVKYSCTPDVIDALGESAEAILEAFSHQPDVTLRVNTLKCDRASLLERLSADRIEAIPTERSPFGIRLKNHASSDKIAELIGEGAVYIQDEASQLAVLALNPKPGMSLLDACSCPGGKAFSAAMLMDNTGRISACDLHKNKLSLISSGAERLGLSIIETAERNGSVYDSSLEASFDAVLCDAPCSGLGVIAKKPEIRYKTADEFERLPEIQYSILSNCSRYLKHGGVLLYSTCTLNKAENEAVARKFAAEHPELVPEDFAISDLESERGMLTLLPHVHGTDGFFISKFRKVR